MTFGKRETPPSPAAATLPGTRRDGNERAFRRTRAFKGGVIIYDGGLMSCPCRVTDLSSAGARLHFDHDLALPHRFTLVIGLDGIAVDCALAWYDARKMGVRFLSPMRQVSPRQAQSLQPSDALRGPRITSMAQLPEAEMLAAPALALPPSPEPQGLVAELPEVPEAGGNVVRFPRRPPTA